MTHKESIKVLIADDDVEVLETYAKELRDRARSGNRKELAELAGELFGESQCNDTTGASDHFDVTACNQGLAAVERVAVAVDEGRPFDLVILDIRMPPGISGVEAGSRIRAIDPCVPIFFVTGYSDISEPEIRKRVPPPKLMRYMIKPIATSRLPTMIAEAVAQAG